MKSKSPIQIVKDPETFFPIVTKYFQEEGVINHLQAKFLVEISREVHNSKRQQLSPMKPKLIKKTVSSEFAMQFVLQYLLKKNLVFTTKCGEIELPSVFIIYKTTTTISNKLKLHKHPSEWLSEVLFDHQKNKNSSSSYVQINENINPINISVQDDNFDIDFDSDDTTGTNANENSINDDRNDVFEENKANPNDYVSVPSFKNKQIVGNPKLNAFNKHKHIINDLNFDSDSS